MSRSELSSALVTHYQDNSLLISGCGANLKRVAPDISLQSPEAKAILSTSDVLCVNSRKLTVMLHLRDDALLKVRVVVTNTEM